MSRVKQIKLHSASTLQPRDLFYTVLQHCLERLSGASAPVTDGPGHRVCFRWFGVAELTNQKPPCLDFAPFWLACSITGRGNNAEPHPEVVGTLLRLQILSNFAGKTKYSLQRTGSSYSQLWANHTPRLTSRKHWRRCRDQSSTQSKAPAPDRVFKQRWEQQL